jgi:ketosteroid isomerase-like protein
MLSSMNTIADVETLYARLSERDYEAVMSYLADDIAWIVADNSPLADRSPYNGIGEVRSGIFDRPNSGFRQTCL